RPPLVPPAAVVTVRVRPLPPTGPRTHPVVGSPGWMPRGGPFAAVQGRHSPPDAVTIRRIRPPSGPGSFRGESMTTLSPPRAGRTPLRGLAGVASALVWIAAVPGPTAVFLSAFTVGNHAGSAPAQVGMVLLIGGMVLTGIAGTCAGVVVVVWLRRARAAAAEAGTWPQRWSEGWAVAAWFVPVLNLWVPAAVVSDVARAADPGSDRLRTSCRIWWAAWLGAGFALWIAFVGVPLFGPGAPALIVWFATFSFLSAGFFAVAAATFTQVVRRVTEWHDASRAAATGVLGTAAAATAATTVTAPVPTPGAEAQPERRTEEQAANRAGAEPEADS